MATVSGIFATPEWAVSPAEYLWYFSHQQVTSDLKIEQKANAFGTENEEGCVAASTIIYEDL
jgi:hypothetical protein